jgi:anti-sigma factor RsiW
VIMTQARVDKEFCEEAARIITDYVSGGLDRPTVERFEAHLKECPDCVSFLETYKEAIRAGKSLSCEDMPASMQVRLREFFKDRIGRLPPKT